MRLAAWLAVLLLLPSWLGLAGGWSWLLDLCANFRWQYLIGSAAIAAWALWRRRWPVAAAAALTLLLNAALIGRLAWHPEVGRAGLQPDFILRVISLNVLTPNTHKRAVLDYLTAADADVILLTEVDRRWLNALQPLQAKYPYRVEHPGFGNAGIALLSRVPWQTAGILRAGPTGLPSIEAGMSYRGRSFVLIGTHPLSPLSPRRAALRNRQLAWLAGHVMQLGQPALLTGDFNATPWSAGLRLATGGNLGFRSLQAPWRPTWEARSVLAIPIDQVLCTAPLVIVRRSVGPDVGSDHRPLEYSVGWGMEGRHD
ncbi:MAG TPA: endonuclease/exonuclease/phosphatase family protein [Steroidobacteraceae bacterium]|nr:endonuclease/exonuclease/phosphatase family protein [Steroidobacteraceae bacterium]